MLGPGKDAVYAIKVIARREVVCCDKCFAANLGANANVAFQDNGHQTISPASAEATQSSIEASAGRYP